MPPSSVPPNFRGPIAPFLVMDVMDEAARLESAGHQVMHLEVGQPGTGAPRAVLDAAHAALDSGPLGYGLAVGDRALRERIAAHYASRFEVVVDPDAIMVTTGASAAFVLAFLAAFEPGAAIACTVPGYPCYRNIARALGLRPVEVRVDASTGYQLQTRHLELLAEKPAGLIVASPANPTGSVIDAETMRELLEYCAAHGIVAIVDEIYQGLVYRTDAEYTALAMDRDAWVINSFSKYYSMTGWRLGWMVAPPKYRRTLEVLSQNLAICAPVLSQRAALAAFEAEDELGGHLLRYSKNRTRLLSCLKEAGVERFAPADGAFYVYADFSAFTDDSLSFCREMLSEIFVATTPGVDFDPELGHRMVRLSYCTSSEQVEEACRRLIPFLATRRRT